MAIILCPECNCKISDKASTCPHCGLPLPKEPLIAAFILQRDSKAFFCAVKYEVYLDYQLWGILKNGDYLNATLECGVHHLKLIDKNNFNKAVYDSDFTIGIDGLTMQFSAATTITMRQFDHADKPNPNAVRRIHAAQNIPATSIPSHYHSRGGNICPRCGSIMTIQTVSESRNAGCLTIAFYVFLALTIFGLLIIIPLMLRKKTVLTSYSVCQCCGYKRRL